MRSIPERAGTRCRCSGSASGEHRKIALITWGAFFPIWLNTFAGVKDVHPDLPEIGDEPGREPGADHVPGGPAGPYACPSSSRGSGKGLGISLVVLVAAELAGASAGVGWRLRPRISCFRVDIMFIGLGVLGALGFLLDQIFSTLQGYFFPWYADRK